MRVDLFGVREGGTIDGALHRAAAARGAGARAAARRYLLEAVVRTVKIGHPFTQGTADSNEVWLDVDGQERRPRDRPQRRPGTTTARSIPWSHFVNVYMLDREGNRIDRRNPQDIFIPLYNHQIPPGAADVVHYLLDVPADVDEPITVEVEAAVPQVRHDLHAARLRRRTSTNDLPIIDARHRHA